jgi:two-component system, sensor histidine kinase PdtaS
MRKQINHSGNKKWSLAAILLLWATVSCYCQGMQEFHNARGFSKKYKIDSAYIHMQKALKFSHSASEKQKALLYMHYGKLLKLKEKTDSSFLYYQKAADIYEKYNNPDSLLYVKISLAELFRFRVMVDKAELYIKQAEKILSNETPTDIRAYYYNRRAAIEAMFFSKPYSIRLSKRVIAMQDAITDKEIVVYSYNELGYMYENTDPERSRRIYYAALSLAERYNLLIPKADVLVLLSRLGDETHQIRYLEQAFAIAMSVDNKDLQMNISGRLSGPYQAKHNYKQALKYSQITLGLQKQMYDSRAVARTAEMERKYNLNKAEQALKLKNAEMQGAEKTIVLTVIITILTLLVLAIVVYFFAKTRKSNKKLAMLSEENVFLLSEANHRINNNLQLIIILISDQIRKLDTNAQETLKKILSKVESIATLHRHLYKSPDKQYIDGGEYLSEVLSNFSDLFSEQQIQTQFTIERISLLNEQAIYMGLLVTELTINSLKHAFSGQHEKYIAVEFTQQGNAFNFRFSDNGKSVAGKIITPRLIDRLCRQLKVIPVINTDNGFLFYFEKKISL